MDSTIVSPSRQKPGDSLPVHVEPVLKVQPSALSELEIETAQNQKDETKSRHTRHKKESFISKLSYCFCLKHPRDRDAFMINTIAVIYFLAIAMNAIPKKLMINQVIAGSAENPNSESAFVDSTSHFINSAISFFGGRYTSGLGDYIGRKPVLIVAAFLFIVSRFMYLAAKTPGDFYFAGFVAGAFECFYFSSMAWISDVFPEHMERSRRLGQFTGLVGGFGFFIGVPMGAVLSSRHNVDFPFKMSILFGLIVIGLLVVLPVDDTLGIKRKVAPAPMDDEEQEKEDDTAAASRPPVIVAAPTDVEIALGSTRSGKTEIDEPPSGSRPAVLITPVVSTAVSSHDQDQSLVQDQTLTVTQSQTPSLSQLQQSSQTQNQHQSQSQPRRSSPQSPDRYDDRGATGNKNDRALPQDLKHFLIHYFPVSIGAFKQMKKAENPLDWLTNFLLHTATGVLNLVLIQYSLSVLGFSAIQTAYLALAIGLGLGIFSPLFLHKYSPVPLATYTMAIFSVGVAVLASAGTGAGSPQILGLTGIAICAIGTPFVPALQANILRQYSQEEQGEVSGMLGQQNTLSLLPSYILSLGFALMVDKHPRGAFGEPVYFPGSAFAVVRRQFLAFTMLMLTISKFGRILILFSAQFFSCSLCLL